MRRTDLLPHDAAPCIWMTAGVVSYKLCDREYDCENCPLDAALRSAATDEHAHEVLGPAALEFRDDRKYHSGHTWVQSVSQGRVRCGIDAFAARLLRPLTSVILPAMDSRLRQGQVGCWLASHAELVPLRSPLSGTVIRRNSTLQATPGLATSSPYDTGWLFDLALSDPKEERRLISAGKSRRLAETQLEKLHERAARSLERDRPAVGATLADGGTRLTDLRRVLGRRRYLRLILPFLR